MAKITVNNLRMSQKDGAVKCFASVDISGQVEIFGVKLMENQNGYWVSMPQRESTQKAGSERKWFDVVKVKGEQLKQEITDALVKAYEKATSAEPAGAGLGEATEDTPF